MCLELNKILLVFQNVQLVSPAECICSAPLNEGSDCVESREERRGKKAKQEKSVQHINFKTSHIVKYKVTW